MIIAIYKYYGRKRLKIAHSFPIESFKANLTIRLKYLVCIINYTMRRVIMPIKTTQDSGAQAQGQYCNECYHN